MPSVISMQLHVNTTLEILRELIPLVIDHLPTPRFCGSSSVDGNVPQHWIGPLVVAQHQRRAHHTHRAKHHQSAGHPRRYLQPHPTCQGALEPCAPHAHRKKSNLPRIVKTCLCAVLHAPSPAYCGCMGDKGWCGLPACGCRGKKRLQQRGS